jgi:hypothetical protein
MENVIQASTYGVTDRQAVKQPATVAARSRPVAGRLSARSKAAGSAARQYAIITFIAYFDLAVKIKCFFIICNSFRLKKYICCLFLFQKQPEGSGTGVRQAAIMPFAVRRRLRCTMPVAMHIAFPQDFRIVESFGAIAWPVQTRSKAGELFPRVGETFPKVEETFPKVGEAFPKVGELFPKVGRCSPKSGKPFSGLDGKLGGRRKKRWRKKEAVPTRQGQLL